MSHEFEELLTDFGMVVFRACLPFRRKPPHTRAHAKNIYPYMKRQEKNRHMEIKMTFNTLHKHTTTQVKVEKGTQRPFPSILEYHSS